MSAPHSRTANNLLVIDGATVASLVSPGDAVELAAEALRKTSDATAKQDVRRTLDLPGASGTCLSLMYASLDDGAHFGAKVQSVFPQNFEHGLPSHQGAVLLFSGEHGRPVALIDATAITGLRTPACGHRPRALSRPGRSHGMIAGSSPSSDMANRPNGTSPRSPWFVRSRAFASGGATP